MLLIIVIYLISAVNFHSKDVRLPVQLQRAMAAEAEAAREARAKVIAAEGEQKAARALREASEVNAKFYVLKDFYSKVFRSSTGNWRFTGSPSIAVFAGEMKQHIWFDVSDLY